MSKNKLIIDTSVVSSSGITDGTQSKLCRHFLSNVYENGYHVVISDVLYSEWKRHESMYAIEWRKALKDKRRLHRIECPEDNALREKIKQVPCVIRDITILPIVMKDIHLIELAMVSDKSIVSLDEQVRNHLKNICISIDDIKIVIWVNPTRDDEKPIDWLVNGAEPEEFRMLGYIDSKKALYRNGHRIKKEAKS